MHGHIDIMKKSAQTTLSRRILTKKHEFADMGGLNEWILQCKITRYKNSK